MSRDNLAQALREAIETLSAMVEAENEHGDIDVPEIDGSVIQVIQSQHRRPSRD